jgi:hypothetical protein
MSYGQAEKACENFKLWPSNPGLCGVCAWPEQDHQEKTMLQLHQERVVTEKKELDEKIVKLHKFCFGGGKTILTIDPAERDRLESQYTAMKQYSDILGKRIAAF